MPQSQITDHGSDLKPGGSQESRICCPQGEGSATKVAYGRRTARKRNNSRAHKVTLAPGAQSVPETRKFPGAQSVPTGPGAQSVPTVDISGSGGDVVGSIRKRPKTKPAWAPPVLTEVFSAERDELLKILAIAELVQLLRRMLTIGVATPKPWLNGSMMIWPPNSRFERPTSLSRVRYDHPQPTRSHAVLALTLRGHDSQYREH